MVHGTKQAAQPLAFLLHVLQSELYLLSVSAGSAAPYGAGVQIATKQIDEGIAAGLMAAEAGATWLDLNCGCPIYGKRTDTHTSVCLLLLAC